MALEFKLPDVGEGLHEGEIVKWHVKEGDTVNADQHMVDVLTDKATVEITAPKAGKILKILTPEGKKIAVGDIMVAIGTAGEVYGGTAARDANGAQAAHAPVPAPVSAPNSSIGVSATPAVRKLAQELGVDLSSVKGTGPNGRITEDDVRSQKAGGTKTAAASLVSHGPEERVPFRGIRRKTAELMAQSLRSTASVTHIDEVDVTSLVALREKSKADAQAKGVKLTYLAYIIKAAVNALKQFPYFNSSLDEAKGEVVLKKFYNVAIAMATEQGLLTPVIRDCDKKSVFDIAGELDKLTMKARDGKISPAELQGSSFTVTSIGGIGGIAATPIINYPEAAILAVFKIVKRPMVVNGQVAVRDMMNLGLTFDHRIQDGADAARFTNAIIEQLQKPETL